MIQLKDVSYVHLGSPDLESAENFATACLGLQIAERGKKDLYLRSDERAHTLCYSEGDPNDQTVGFEVEDEANLQEAAATLEQLGHAVQAGTAQEAERRKVRAFIRFRDPTGNHIELVVRPERNGRRYFASRDAGITGFSHIGLNSTDPARDERFWTQICNARVSDRIGDIPLMRVNAIHHTIALVRAPTAGIQHINHQVETSDDVLRSYYFLNERRVPIVFGPGRHPTSGARFLYFTGPDGMIFEYSVVADVITKEGRDAILAACPAPDILVNNAGGPPPGDFRKFEREDWIKALDGNMLAPIALIKATLDGMIARRFGRIVNVTSHAVKAPVAMLALSNGARTGLTGCVAGLARSTAEHNVTINKLVPGTFDTDRLKSNLAALARNSSREVSAVTEEIRTANPTKRFGKPRRIRRDLRVPVLGASRLYHRTKHPDR